MDIVVYHTGRLDPDDLEALAASEALIHGECCFRRWDLPTFAEHGRNYVCEVDGVLAGSAQMLRDWDDPDLAYLAGFGLVPAFRGQGISSLFLEELIALAGAEGIKRLELTVRPDNAAALKVYKQAGFSEDSRHEAKYGRGEDRLVLRLDLRAGP